MRGAHPVHRNTTQNIPNIENDVFKIRGAFIAEPGYVILAADYDQLEMRLLAAAAQEPDMVDIFLRKWDIHMGNASLMFGIPYEELVEAKKIDKQVKEGKLPAETLTARVHECLKARMAAKSIGFGLNYGMGPGRLANMLGVSRLEAEEKIALYMKRYPAVAQFYAESLKLAEQYGFAYTLLGRRRSVADIMADAKIDRMRAERVASNLPIQGGAADVVKMAQLGLDIGNIERLGVRPLLQVHDELVFEVPAEALERAKSEIQDWMENSLPTPLMVPLTVSIGTGPSWGNAH